MLIKVNVYDQIIAQRLLTLAAKTATTLALETWLPLTGCLYRFTLNRFNENPTSSKLKLP